MKTVLKSQKYIQLSALALVLLFFVAACAKKKKSDDFQNFTGLGYNAVPKTITGGSGLNIAVKGIDINFDGKTDGLYICRTGGIKQDLTPVSAPAFAPTGAGFTDSPTVDFSAMTCSTLPVAHAVVANGRVERVVILNPGAGCSGNQVSITSPVGQSGLGATATLSLDRGKVVRVTMNSKGAGYVAPTVALAGAGGTGAQMGVNIGHDASGILNNSGQITGLYLINLGDGRYNATDAGTTPLVATISGDTGTAAPITVSAANLADSELDPDGKCSVTYDPTNADPSKRYIPQMLFTWPVTPTVGLDVNGDTNADYYLYTEEDGSSRVMTNSDGSGSIAKLIIKNPMINESTNWLYQKLDYGQVIGFDILDNSTIANNVLGRIALDREDATYVDAANPMPIISPIRNGVHYAAPMDVNILCADRVACNAVAYSLSNTGSAAIPNFGNVNLDTTGYDYSGAMHAIRPGDSSTISFRQLPFGNYILNYIVRDAAGRESSVQTIT
ncbi:MAG TPA: hypothetical protein PLY93_11565, partial [Turneriella sp.]|nr:hypothetical protein [Turneriella sp.]